MPALFSDYFRYIILSKYGGLYFDLDIFFFKNFSYLIDNYRNFLTSWGGSDFPNNALYLIRDKEIIDKMNSLFIDYGGSTLCFQDLFNERGENQKKLSFESEVDINILPCGWFDPMFIDKDSNNNYLGDFEKWFRNNDNSYYYDDIYCYHWHNRNHLPIEINSPFYRNIKQLLKTLNLENYFKL
jgi:hypothetical protein